MRTLPKAVELSPAGLKRVLRDATARVAKENLRRGVAITVAKGGELVQIQPDNSRRRLGKKLRLPVVLTETRFRFD